MFLARFSRQSSCQARPKTGFCIQACPVHCLVVHIHVMKKLLCHVTAGTKCLWVKHHTLSEMVSWSLSSSPSLLNTLWLCVLTLEGQFPHSRFLALQFHLQLVWTLDLIQGSSCQLPQRRWRAVPHPQGLLVRATSPKGRTATDHGPSTGPQRMEATQENGPRRACFRRQGPRFL